MANLFMKMPANNRANDKAITETSKATMSWFVPVAGSTAASPEDFTLSTGAFPTWGRTSDTGLEATGNSATVVAATGISMVDVAGSAVAVASTTVAVT